MQLALLLFIGIGAAISILPQKTHAAEPCFYYYTQDAERAYSSCRNSYSITSTITTTHTGYTASIVNSTSETQLSVGVAAQTEGRCFFYSQDGRTDPSCIEERTERNRRARAELNERREKERLAERNRRRRETSGRVSQRCSNKRSLLAFIPEEWLHCGPGYRFPFLLAGDCPISACQIRVNAGGFGSSLNF